MSEKEKITDLLNRFIRMCDTVASHPDYNRVDIAETIKRLAQEGLRELK